MQRGLIVLAIGLLGLITLTAAAQQTAGNRDALQNLLVNEKEVQTALGSDWSLKAQVDVSKEPPNSITAALIYGNGQTSLLTVLYQFNQESQAHDFFATPFTDEDKILSRDQAEAINEAFKVGQSQGAAEAYLIKIRTGEREALSDDGQQWVLRFRVGRLVASFSAQICIPAHPDPTTGAPIDYQCFNETQLHDGLVKVGQKQLAILFTGH